MAVRSRAVENQLPVTNKWTRLLLWWSSYGEAVAGNRKARAGLVRALHGWDDRDKRTAEGTEEMGGRKGSVAGEAHAWGQGVAREYRAILLGKGAEVEGRVKRKGMKSKESDREAAAMEERGTDVALGGVSLPVPLSRELLDAWEVPGSH